jgi:osmotically-inducible protein OsmY
MRYGLLIAVAAGALSLVLVFPGFDPARATEPPAAGGRDWQLTLRARQALLQDERLAGYNLGVSVRDRVAILWGPVPSLDLAHRAEERLRAVPGLAGVRSELQVEPDGVTSPGQPTSRKAARKRVPISGALTGTAARSSIGPEVVSLPPIEIPAERTQPLAVAPLLAQSSSSTNDDARLERLVGQIQQRQQFRGIRPVVFRGLVYLYGPKGRSQDLFEMAQLVADLPGVKRVIVKEERPDGSR